jgi:hypothetical protein
MNGLRKAFHKGGNSSNRFHIRQHYDIYKEKCEKGKIPMNHWAIPPNVVKAAKVAAQGVKAQGQQQLAFKATIGPREFTRAGTLHAVANLIATNNQVSIFKSFHISELLTKLYSPLRLRITLHSETALFQ